MKDPLTHKQFRCDHCEFVFFYTEFGSAAKIVCPACGEEIILSVPETPQAQSAALPIQETKPVLCSVETCPLLSDGEPKNEIAQQVGLRLREKHKRRHSIMSWTVMLQVCVLIGTALFIAKSLLMTAEETTSPPVALHVKPTPVKELASQTPPPTATASHPSEHIVPHPFVPEVAITEQVIPEIKPPVVIPEPEYVVSPYEVVADIFPLVPIDPPVEPPTLPPPNETITLNTAEKLLASAKSTLTTDPKNSVTQAVKAVKIYEELGEEFPDTAYWILGNAFVSQSWGEPLLESAPAVETMALSPDGRYLLAQLKDKTVCLWDLRSPEKPYPLDSGTAEYVKFVFTPDLRWIIGGQTNGTIRIWDMSLNSPEETRITLAERIPHLQDLQLSADGQWLAAFGNSPRTTTVTENPSADQSIPHVSYFRPDHFGTNDLPPYPVLVWNLRQMSSGVVPIAMSIPPASQPVQVIRFSPDSTRLAIGRKDAIVWVYELTEQEINEEPFILQGHQFAVTQIAFAPNGLWMATGSQDNTVRLWNLTSPKFSPETVVLYGHLGWISALAIDQTGEHILSGSYDHSVRIWNVKRNRIASALTEEPIVLEASLGIPESLAITQDGDKMMMRCKEGSLGIFHLPSLLAADPEYYLQAIAFRNSGLSISESLLTSDDKVLIFSYEHLPNTFSGGIRLWALQPEPFVR